MTSTATPTQTSGATAGPSEAASGTEAGDQSVIDAARWRPFQDSPQKPEEKVPAGIQFIRAASGSNAWTEGSKFYGTKIFSGAPISSGEVPTAKDWGVQSAGPRPASPSKNDSGGNQGQNTPSPTPEALLSSTRQTISTAKGVVEVGKFNDGKQEVWVAIAPREDGSGFKTYKLDLDPKKNELSENDKERIKRMIDYGYFGKLKPEAKPSSTAVVHREGEEFDSRPYKAYGRTFQVLNKGVYQLWYDPNGAGDNKLVWTSKRPLDLSKDLKPRTPLANKFEQIAAPRASAPVSSLELPQTAPSPISATSRPTTSVPRQPSQSFSTLPPLTTLKPA